MRVEVHLLVVGVTLLALPAAASALAPGELTGLECISDNDTGLGTCSGSTDGLAGISALATSPDGRDLYGTSTIDDAVVHLHRAGDGTLTPGECIDDNDPPAGADACALSADGLDLALDVVVTPDGRNVLVASGNDAAVANFSRDPATGALTPAGCVRDNDVAVETCAQSMDGLSSANGLAVSPDGRDVYVAAFGDQSVTQLRRNPATGALTPGGCVKDNDTSAETCGLAADGLAGIEQLAVSPDGANVYAVGTDDDAIVTMTRNTTTGVLSAPSCIDDNDAGEGPDTCGASTDALNDVRSVTVSPDGRSVYTADFLDRAVTRFDRSTSGALTPAGCFSTSGFEPACTSTTFNLNAANGLAVSPAGDVLYVSVANNRSVVSFARNMAGVLTPLSCVQNAASSGCAFKVAGMNIARDVIVSPDGRDVYTQGDSDGAVVHLIGERPPVCLSASSSGPLAALLTVSLSCSDLNGDALTLAVTRAPGGGTLGAVDQVGHSVAYTPNAGFSGLDAFDFRAIADGAPSNIATASLLVGSAAGAPGAPGVPGPPGPPGSGGAPGPAGQPAIKLLALIGSDTVSARRGHRVSFRIAVTAGGKATLDILKGPKVAATVSKTLRSAGRATITWNGKGKPAKGKKATALPRGSYTLRLTVVGTDRQKATDRGRLKLTR